MQDREPRPSQSSFRDSFREAGPYLTLGLELGLTMIVWSVIGYLLDRWLETTPWLTLLGVLVGMVSLFIQLARAAKRSQAEEEDKKAKKQEGTARSGDTG